MQDSLTIFNDWINNVTTFVLKNREGTNAFRGWKPDEIKETLQMAALARTMLVSVGNAGEITGVIHGGITPDKVFHVDNILTTDHKAMPTFLKHFHMMFPNYKLEALRHDKLKIYDVDKLTRKLL